MHNTATTTPTKGGEDLITTRVVQTMLGDVSAMTIWRWRRDPAMQFPAPIEIRGRLYWRTRDVSTWIAAREQAA